jgi:hypothetical protein
MKITMLTKSTSVLKRKMMMAAVCCLLVLSAASTMAQPPLPPRPPRPQNQGAQDEDYGNTLNLGVGLVYYGYLNAAAPIFLASYEFNVARDFTLAPFIGFGAYTSSNNYYYGNENYYYRETIIPVGVKGTYYFDRLIGLDRSWDLWAAASIGFVFDNVTWQDGYHGNEHVDGGNYVRPDIYAGVEYHVSKRIGIYGELSTGISSIGIAVHHR